MIFLDESREQVARAAAPRTGADRAVVGAWATGVSVVELAAYLTVSADRKTVLMLSIVLSAIGAWVFGNVIRLEAAIARIGREQRLAKDTDVLASLPAKTEIARRRWTALAMTSVATVVGIVASVASRTDTLDAVLFAVMSLSTTAGSTLAGMYIRPRP